MVVKFSDDRSTGLSKCITVTLQTVSGIFSCELVHYHDRRVLHQSLKPLTQEGFVCQKAFGVGHVEHNESMKTCESGAAGN